MVLLKSIGFCKGNDMFKYVEWEEKKRKWWYGKILVI